MSSKDREHARALLKMARKDARALSGMMDAGVFADEIFGFHAQQAVEKALKAWCAHRGITYPLTHDLSELFALLREEGYAVDAFDDLLRFNAFAVVFRYEALDEETPVFEREGVTEEIDALLRHVAQLLD
jgi:HEPN domain-containing protein